MALVCRRQIWMPPHPFFAEESRSLILPYSGVPASALPGAWRALTRLHPRGDPDLLGRLSEGALGSVA
eukprot:1027692-Alexandrium_andersonii.AAC.1